MAAVLRARHAMVEPPPWVLEDPIALDLVGPEWRQMADYSDAHWSGELGRQMRAGIAVRSRYAEDRLERGDFAQYVLLGAGLDSFVWRRSDLLGPLRVFEVDHPASQSWKRGRMAELGLPQSRHQVFAPVDFEVGSLDDGLDAVGFDRSARTCFSWLGVVPYLTPEAIDSTLRCVAGCAPGSEVVFEYGLADPYLDDVGREFAARFVHVASGVGEPVQGAWTPDEAEAVVVRCGLEVADHPDRDALEARYFADRSDGLRPWSPARLLAASVPERS
jgi:methyltransferase (TIGR00027 family)